MDKIGALRAQLIQRGLDGFILTQMEPMKSANIRFLCGFTGSNAVLLIGLEHAWLICDGRYTAQAKEQVKGAEPITYKGTGRTADSFVGEMKSNSAIQMPRKVGVEAHAMTVDFYSTFKKSFPEIEITETIGIIEDIAAVKEPAELDAIRKAVAVTDRVFTEVLDKIRPGVTERAIAAEITYLHLKYGAEGNSFEPIVASGHRAALPHGVASEKVIEAGDFITIDIGCYYDGYASDLTRTVVLGKASRKQREIYELVLRAQQAGVKAVRAGVTGAEVDRAAREIIHQGGYGDYFTHGLGHGLGHMVHGRPVLSPVYTAPLEVNNVATVEPGIYIEGFGGVRIEDDVIVTTDGCEVLNKVPRELIEL